MDRNYYSLWSSGRAPRIAYFCKFRFNIMYPPTPNSHKVSSSCWLSDKSCMYFSPLHHVPHLSLRDWVTLTVFGEGRNCKAPCNVLCSHLLPFRISFKFVPTQRFPFSTAGINSYVIISYRINQISHSDYVRLLHNIKAQISVTVHLVLRHGGRH